MQHSYHINLSYGNLHYTCFSFQIVLASGDSKIVVTIKKEGAINALLAKKDKLDDGYKITLANINKNRGQVFTSKDTLVELDTEVILWISSS